MRMGWPIAITFLILVSACLTGCVTTYRTAKQWKSPAIQEGDGYTLGIIELDDQGRFWKPEDVVQVLARVRQAAGKGGAMITVFIHGWHHSARSDDENLAAFRDALRRLRREADSPVYRAARANLFKHEDADIVGVYVAWRGRSLPSFLDYLTFWDRKSAAERIGRGDVVELFSTLNKIWAEANTKGKYTSLVTIGHSFGAQVAFSAVSSILRSRVVEAHSAGVTELQSIAGFGDLLVLVNPAAECAPFAAISEQTRTAKFTKQQTPVMLVVSSETDGATGWWFPFGRRFGVLNEVHRGDEYEQNIRALGWYAPQVTHCLAAEGGRPCTNVADRQVRYRGPHGPFAQAPKSESGEEYAGVWTEADLDRPEEIELAGDLGMTGARLYRVSDHIDPNLPFVVAKATSDMIDGHNDMFNRRFVEFLIRYAAGAELKRFVLLARAQAAAARQ
jgi:hypothetical protein